MLSTELQNQFEDALARYYRSQPGEWRSLVGGFVLGFRECLKQVGVSETTLQEIDDRIKAQFNQVLD